jgi:hypothetical protein
LKAKSLIIPLKRPQYVSVSEGYINAIAWSLFDIELENKPAGSRVGLRYRGIDKSGQKLVIRFTEPTPDQYEVISKRLEELGVRGVTQNNIGAKALVNSIVGVKPEGAKFAPASPMTPSLALLNNPVGIHGSQNPPPDAEILETIFQLGGSPESNLSLAGLWLEALEHRMALDPLLASIDAVVNETFFDSQRKMREKSMQTLPTEFLEVTDNSPFTWFHSSWVKLTSKEWVAALPARVWTDWATTLLRCGYGLAYLWESAWYESLAKIVVRRKGGGLTEMMRLMEPTLPWKFSRSSAEIRDLSSRLKARAQKANQIRPLVESWLAKDARQELEMDQAMDAMAQDEELVEGLKSILSGSVSKTSSQNLWEAIKYSLMTREASASEADHYGFLRSRGRRYLFADPGIEWITVMASLSAKGPGSFTHLGEVMRNLSMAGVRPDPRDLVVLLERAGLARGSADADHGVIVETAF